MDITKLKPNELIRLAITDMKATLAQGHIIDMDNWGSNIGTEQCEVCFAGCVMLQQRFQSVNGEFNFSTFDKVQANAFRALDAIRVGNLEQFCGKLGIEVPLINNVLRVGVFESIYYSEGKEERFYAQMEAIAQLFD